MTEKLPRKCECGGKMVYTHGFGRVFSYCLKCTPVVTIKYSLLTHSPLPPDSATEGSHK